jgi:fructose-1,6-bisphosphatase/inositol monophosphatase family enzyme
MKDFDQLVNTAAGIVEKALLASYSTYVRLGDAGTASVQKNQFGDTALRGDIEAEEAVMFVLRHAKLEAKVFSEEHGEQQINLGQDLPKVTGVLDGIDGSSVYVKDREHGKYGTLLALFAGEDPSYADYLAAGIMQHATGKLLLAVRGKGLVVIDVRTGSRAQAHAKTAQSLQTGAVIAYVDNMSVDKNHPLYKYFSLNDATFAKPLRQAGIETICLGASAAYYAAVATGEADLVGESTRKGNLEIATAYGLAVEAGGVMVTIDGKDLGPQRLLEFGQQTHIPILTAANPSVAEEVIRHIAQPTKVSPAQ